MSEIEYIEDHQKRAESRLLSATRENQEFVDLVKALAKPKQVQEDMLHDMFHYRDIDSAEDEQLDIIGRHLLLEREGRTDDTYRAALKTRAEDIRTSGLPEQLIAIYKSLMDADRVKYEDWEELKSITNQLIAFVDVCQNWENHEDIVTRFKKMKQAGEAIRLGAVETRSFRLSNTPNTFTKTGLRGKTSGSASKVGMAFLLTSKEN